MPSRTWAPLATLLTALVSVSVADEKTQRLDQVEKPPRPGEVREFEITPHAKMKFCWIPSGECQLGSPKEELKYVTDRLWNGNPPGWMEAESESNRGKYRTRGYWLGKYPVTQIEWQAVMDNNPSNFSKNGRGKSQVKDLDTGRFPVEMVSWEDCGTFLSKLNSRGGTAKVFGKPGRFVLPNEDEWEYGCRGGLGNRHPFYFGDVLNGNQANCDGNHPYGTETKGSSKHRTTEVGIYESLVPHPWHLCDMHGNVWQWCENWSDNEQKYRILRGGSFNSDAGICRAGSRTRDVPDFRDVCCGFRVCFRQD